MSAHEIAEQQLMRLPPSVREKFLKLCYALTGYARKEAPMDRELFLKVWFAELGRLAPVASGESHLASEFRASPVVQSCLIALELVKDDAGHQLVLLEENLTSLREMPSLSFAARNMVDGMLAKVKMMQEAIRE